MGGSRGKDVINLSQDSPPQCSFLFLPSFPLVETPPVHTVSRTGDLSRRVRLPWGKESRSLNLTTINLLTNLASRHTTHSHGRALQKNPKIKFLHFPRGEIWLALFLKHAINLLNALRDHYHRTLKLNSNIINIMCTFSLYKSRRTSSKLNVIRASWLCWRFLRVCCIALYRSAVARQRRPECTMAMAIRVAKRRGNVTAKERGQLARSSQVLATLPAASKRSLTRATENKCHFTQLKIITEILHDFRVLNFLNWIVLHF